MVTVHYFIDGEEIKYSKKYKADFENIHFSQAKQALEIFCKDAQCRINVHSNGELKFDCPKEVGKKVVDFLNNINKK